MKRLQTKHYIIVIVVFMAIVAVAIALTLSKDSNESFLPTGIIGCVVGLVVGLIIGVNVKKRNNTK